MTKPLTALLLVLAPLLAIVRLGDRTARDAGRWFEEADEVWEPFLVDDDEGLTAPDAASRPLLVS